MTKTPKDKNKYSEIGGNKSLMKLAQDLGVPFSVAKIIHDHAQPTITEEWIKEKAIEIYNLSYYESFEPKQIANYIRSLVEELSITVDK